MNVDRKCLHRLSAYPQTDSTINKLFDKVFCSGSQLELALSRNHQKYYHPYHPGPSSELRLNPILIPLLSVNERDRIINTAKRLGRFSDEYPSSTEEDTE